MSSTNDDDYLCYDEEVQSPPPNLSRSDPNEVGLKKEDLEFDEEEKVKITEKDPPNGHISETHFSGWRARNDSWGTAAHSIGPNKRIDDIQDPGVSTTSPSIDRNDLLPLQAFLLPIASSMSRKKDDGHLCDDEEVPSPPPNVSGSDRNKVGRKQDEHEFDEEETVNTTEEDPPDGHISKSHLYEWWARNEATGLVAHAFGPKERIDDSEDPGVPTRNTYGLLASTSHSINHHDLFPLQAFSSPTSVASIMSRKNDDGHLWYDEEAQVSESDRNEVGLKKDEHEFNEEQKVKTTEEDPRDGHTSESYFSEGWARNEAPGSAAHAFDPNKRTDDIEDPGMSSRDKNMISHLRGLDESPGAEAIPPPRTRHHSVPGAQRVYGLRNTGREDDTSTVITDEPSPHTVSAQLVNIEEERNRAQQEVIQGAVVADVVREVATDNSVRRWKLASIFLVLIVIGVVLAITFLQKEDEESDSSGVHWVLLLKSISSDNGAALLEPSTPQYKALEWVTALPNLSNETIVGKYALATLYYSANGDSWYDNTLWLADGPGRDECSRWKWYGLDCTDGAVSEVVLHSNNLEGTLPPEIGFLTTLTTLVLSGNALTGPIPNEIGLVTGLRTLSLYDNMLTGNYTCPEFIKNCTIFCDDPTNVACRSL